MDEQNNPLLNSLPNITGINIQGCSGITGTLDFTNCKYLQTVNTKNTNVGVILPQYTKVTTLELGNPVQLVLNNPYYPINITIQSSSNLNSLELDYINTAGYVDAANGNVNSYNLFNTLTT